MLWRLCILNFLFCILTSKDTFPLEQTSSVIQVQENLIDIDMRDLTFEEFEKYEPIYGRRSSTDEINEGCDLCVKTQKLCEKYKKMYLVLLRQNRLLKKKYYREKFNLKTQNKKLIYRENKINMLKHNLIDKCDISHVNEYGKTLITMLSKKPGEKYSDNEKYVALNIQYKSNALYNLLKKKWNLNIPCIASIYNWIPFKNFQPGANKKLLENYNKIMTGWSIEKKQVNYNILNILQGLLNLPLNLI